MKTKVAIVIPNWNGADLIRECLASLKEQTYRADIIVVDNGSVDDSVSIISNEYPDATLIKLPKNTGFDGGVNAGIRQALPRGYDAIAVFNNDAVAHPDWLSELVKTLASDAKIGIVSCKQLHANKEYFDSTGDHYTIWGMPFPRARNIRDEGQHDTEELIFSAPAAATLYRVELFKDIGLFDEKFFAYYEDVDISFRAQLAGWKIMYQPRAEVYHEISATSSKLGGFTRYHATKNFFMLYIKNMPGWLFWKYLPLFLLQSLRLGLSSLLRGGAWAYLKGVVMALVYLPATLADRFRIQKSRKVPVSYIDGLLYHGRPPRIPPVGK